MEHPNTSSSTFDFPPFVVLMLLVAAAMLGGLLGSGLAYVIALAQGQDLLTLMGSIGEDMPLTTRNTLRLINLASHFMTFTFPAVVLTLILYRRRWGQFLLLDRAPLGMILLISAFFMFSVFPVAQFTYWLNQQIPLPEWATRMENNAAGMLKGLMIMDSPMEFLFNILVMAVLPAVGEELMFRGVVQQKLAQQTQNAHLAIWLTALIFSAVHFQFEGFLARMILGAALGYLFYWTRNLWVPIVAHFLTNALQITAQYFYGEEMDIMQSSAEEAAKIPWAGLALGVFFLYITGRYLHQYHLTNTSP